MFRNLLLISLAAAQAAVAATPALMPLPVKMQAGQGQLTVDVNFSVAATAYSGERLDGVLQRFVAHLARQTGIPILDVKPADPSKATLRVQCAAAGAGYPQLGEDESYTLDVTPGGALILNPPRSPERCAAWRPSLNWSGLARTASPPLPSTSKTGRAFPGAA